tara:strand:- start:363 stop:1439 length:1077 start_codon:yes stop_codon:yes gene_type:complete
MFLVAISLAGYATTIAAESTIKPLLPPLPAYPAPQKNPNPADQGELYFSSTTPGEYKWLLYPDDSVVPTTVKGTLFLPKQASLQNPVPAMVILHGSGGVQDSREMAYGRELAAQGIAGFVVHSYEARGVTEVTSYGERVTLVTDADEVADAYAALKFLNRHPAIRADRIGVMGFSYGGMATRAALDQRIYDTQAEGVAPFALHLDYYGPCHFDLQTTGTTGAPLYSLRGAEDGSNDLVACALLEQKLRQAGSPVGSHIFPSAGHAWEMERTRAFVSTLNPAPCHQILTADGNWIINSTFLDLSDARTREDKYHLRQRVLKHMKDQCMSDGYIIGQDKQVHKLSNDLLKILINRHLLAE